MSEQTPEEVSVALWATQRKAFLELSRERERAVDRNTMPTCANEWWRGYEAALDDLIRTVTSETPTADPAHGIPSVFPPAEGSADYGTEPDEWCPVRHQHHAGCYK